MVQLGWVGGTWEGFGRGRMDFYCRGSICVVIFVLAN